MPRCAGMARSLRLLCPLCALCVATCSIVAAFGGEEPAGLTVLLPTEGLRLVHGKGGLPVDFVTKGAMVHSQR